MIIVQRRWRLRTSSGPVLYPDTPSPPAPLLRGEGSPGAPFMQANRTDAEPGCMPAHMQARRHGIICSRRAVDFPRASAYPRRIRR